MVVEEDERASIGDSMASLGARENPAQTQNEKMAKNKQRLRKKLSISDLSFFGNLRSGVLNASVNPGNHRKSRINLLCYSSLLLSVPSFQLLASRVEHLRLQSRRVQTPISSVLAAGAPLLLLIYYVLSTAFALIQPPPTTSTASSSSLLSTSPIKPTLTLTPGQIRLSNS